MVHSTATLASQIVGIDVDLISIRHLHTGLMSNRYRSKASALWPAVCSIICFSIVSQSVINLCNSICLRKYKKHRGVALDLNTIKRETWRPWYIQNLYAIGYLAVVQVMSVKWCHMKYQIIEIILDEFTAKPLIEAAPNLSDQQFYCLLSCDLYWRFKGKHYFPIVVLRMLLYI